MLTCGSKNCTSSDAMAMSPQVTRSMPAPQQMPFTATIIGLAIVRNGWVASWGASHSLYCERYLPSCGALPSSGTFSTSAPEQNARPLAATMMRPDVVVALGAGVGVVELVDHLLVDRVQPLGAVEGDDGAAALDLVDDRLVRHAGQSSRTPGGRVQSSAPHRLGQNVGHLSGRSNRPSVVDESRPTSSDRGRDETTGRADRGQVSAWRGAVMGRSSAVRSPDGASTR